MSHIRDNIQAAQHASTEEAITPITQSEKTSTGSRARIPHSASFNQIPAFNTSPSFNQPRFQIGEDELDALERGSYFGTNTSDSASGDLEDATPLQHIIVETLWKADKARDLAVKTVESSYVTTPQERQDLLMKSVDEDQQSQHSGQSSQSQSKIKHAVPHKAFLRYINQARRHEDSLFSQLDTKSSRALLICDPHASQILWVNEAAERLFGRLDLVGSTLETLMQPGIAARHPGVVAAYRDRYIAEYRKTGTPCDSRLLDLVKARRLVVVRRSSGREESIHVDAWVRTLRLPGEPLDDMARIMAMECYEAEQYHIDTNTAKIFHAALENVSDAIVVSDFNGIIEYTNKSAELLTGYPLSALKAVRASVNIFVPEEMVNQHEGYLAHFRQNRTAKAVTLQATTHETVVSRRVEMRTAFGKQEILLRVDAAYDKLIGYLKSTKEFIPREDFDSERLKLLLPASIVKLLRGASSVSDITSYFWEFDNRTVMFTDVQGFSTWAKNRSIKSIHDRMQPMFSEFETIVRSFGGELIHRIGESMVIIFGFNGEERHHARYALAAAVEIQQWSVSNNYDIKIGLHSGSVGAGIFGSDKGRPSFDIWGPVVNTAKKLESNTDAGTVHLSKEVREALGHRFSNQLHIVLREKELEGIKGVEDGTKSFVLPVKAENANNTVGLPEKFLQRVGFQRAKFARWKITNEETERRLAELQKASRS